MDRASASMISAVSQDLTEPTEGTALCCGPLRLEVLSSPVGLQRIDDVLFLAANRLARTLYQLQRQIDGLSTFSALVFSQAESRTDLCLVTIAHSGGVVSRGLLIPVCLDVSMDSPREVLGVWFHQAAGQIKRCLPRDQFVLGMLTVESLLNWLSHSGAITPLGEAQKEVPLIHAAPF